MDEGENSIVVIVLSFGPLTEVVGRRQTITLDTNSTSLDLIKTLNLESWLKKGLKIAVNGKIKQLETILSDSDEIALLPPVSGG